MDIMLFFPFLFFSSLFLINYRKQGLDVYSYLILIYAFSAFNSIFVDMLNLYRDFDIFKHPLGFIAPLSYCLLIAICLYPFKKFKSNKIVSIEPINIHRYNYIIWIFFFIFLLMIAASSAKLNEILFTQTMASVRDSFYHGDAESVWSNYSGWFRYFIAIISLLSASCYVLILFFFYNIAVLKKPIWFNFITLLGSLTPLIMSIYIADRSGFIHWLLIFCLCFVIFRKQMSPKAKKQFSVFGLVILSFIFIYFISVTISRFGEDVGGTSDDVYTGLIYYCGSSYIQYCNFFNTLDFDSPFSLSPLFPLSYWLFGLPSYFEQCEIVEKIYHHGVSNFSTFLGMILSMSGRFVMTIFVFIYFIVSTKFTYRPNISIITLRKLVLFFIVVLIVNNGLFGYFYMSYSSICNILIWIFISRFLTKKRNVA